MVMFTTNAGVCQIIENGARACTICNKKPAMRTLIYIPTTGQIVHFEQMADDHALVYPICEMCFNNPKLLNVLDLLERLEMVTGNRRKGEVR